jgi:hypothetical protein
MRCSLSHLAGEKCDDDHTANFISRSDHVPCDIQIIAGSRAFLSFTEETTTMAMA